MSNAEAGDLNEHRIEAQGARFDGALDEQVRQALERSQVLDGGAAPQDAGNLLQAAMRLKNMGRLREQEEARLRELEAQVRAEALATVKLRKQAAELAGVETRAKNIARVRAETVARLAELEQQIRDDALATVALRQEITRRQAQQAAQPAPSPAAPPPAAAEAASPLQPEPAPVIVPDDLPAAPPVPPRTGPTYLAWSGWGVAMLLLAAWWGSRGMMPAAVPVAPPAAAPAMHAAPAGTLGGQPVATLKLETELHTPPR